MGENLVGGDGECSNLSVVREILHAFSCGEDGFAWVNDLPGDHRRAHAAKIRRELGWEPVHADFVKGLSETIA